jgi:chondroitin 4-sulfotransferase 11
MIINHKYKFIFVHIQKTAGSSIANVLSDIDGTESILYPHSFINAINLEQYNEYFKFCFVRNPWDRLFSWYKMMLKKGVHNDFSDYLLNNSSNFFEFLNLTNVIYETYPLEWDGIRPYPKSISFNQLDYITDNNGNILVDFIGRFESLNEDYNKVMEKIGITNLPLPHINKSTSGEYKYFYTESDIEKVYKLYKKDIKYFNYTF